MNPSPVFVPVLPENSPFTKEQIAWLNGYFAGLFSWKAAGGATTAPPSRALRTSLWFGSQTGTAESLAKKASKTLAAAGAQTTLKDMSGLTLEGLKQEKTLLVLTSTYGEGEAPDNAKDLIAALKATEPLGLSELRYGVFGIGDSNYAKFCQAAKDFDAELERHGAKRILPLAVADVDYDEAYERWIAEIREILRTQSDPVADVAKETEPARPIHDKKNPFDAKILQARALNGPGSSKDTRHVVISLEGSDLSYEAGDALGVFGRNCPDLVDQVLGRLGATGKEDGEEGLDLRETLSRKRELGRPTSETMGLVRAAGGKVPETLEKGFDVLDLLTLVEPGAVEPSAFRASLRKMQPRLYSISSSLKAHPREVHLTVGAVRYEIGGRKRKGVCSTFFAENRAERVPVFVHANKAFRLPNPDAPLVMVGPGTGIAPFRAFLEERAAVGAKGKNWLFFGDQKSECDFLYEEELLAWKKDGHLSRLDLAFSRDQEKKVYVQDRMIENAKELYAWMNEGGTFTVCGDASRMAKDVDQALAKVAVTAGGLSPEAAAEWTRRLQAEKRYLRDVY